MCAALHVPNQAWAPFLIFRNAFLSVPQKKMRYFAIQERPFQAWNGRKSYVPRYFCDTWEISKSVPVRS